MFTPGISRAVVCITHVTAHPYFVHMKTVGEGKLCFECNCEVTFFKKRFAMFCSGYSMSLLLLAVDTHSASNALNAVWTITLTVHCVKKSSLR